MKLVSYTYLSMLILLVIANTEPSPLTTPYYADSPYKQIASNSCLTSKQTSAHSCAIRKATHKIR